MQKGQTFWILLLFTVTGLCAQSRTVLNANNVSAPISANGLLFSGGLEIPKGSGINSISSAQIWIGGKSNNQLHIAARLHDSLKQNDFWAGPLNTTTGAAQDSTTWNKIFKVTAQEITLHRQNYKKEGYTTPDGIKNWPGSSPQGQGFAQILAPFVDFNTNRIYEPELGEYPYIKGDEAAYFIINDNLATHHATGGLPMGVEVHGMAYQFTNTPEVENTVFLKLSFINRSANNYDSVFAGIWSSFSLGNPTDNYISTYPEKSAILAYNGDTLDENGYGINPPAQAIVFLNRPLQYSIEISGDNSMRGIPNKPQDFYNYLKRTWRDGSPLTDGFNGYKAGLATDFIYNGDPCNLNNPRWTENGSAISPGNRSALGSIGPVNLAAGGFLQLDVAFVWARDSTGGALGSVCKLNNTIDDVIAFYKKEISSTNNTKTPVFTAYPNPTSNLLYLTVEGGNNTQVSIVNLSGQTVVANSFSSGDTAINTSHLADGIYILKVETSNGIATQKIVIQH